VVHGKDFTLGTTLTLAANDEMILDNGLVKR
jgi:hypothetical protein